MIGQSADDTKLGGMLVKAAGWDAFQRNLNRLEEMVRQDLHEQQEIVSPTPKRNNPVHQYSLELTA